MRIQTEDDTARTLAKRELPEAETKELLPAGKGLHEVITLVCIGTLLEDMTRENARDLTEDVGTGVHGKKREVWLDLPLPD